MLDSVVTAETPEGILLEMRPAGMSARFAAFAIDWLIRIAIMYAMAFFTLFFGGFGFAFWLILFFLLDWFYPVVFELGRDGATATAMRPRVPVGRPFFSFVHVSPPSVLR